jgi:hypothetical protein
MVMISVEEELFIGWLIVIQIRDSGRLPEAFAKLKENRGKIIRLLSHGSASPTQKE